MSVFMNYEAASRHYDETRVPVGLEIILGCLARHAKPLESLTLLDAGCGTGAYAAAVSDHVGRIEALDMSPGMLSRARQRLGALVENGRAGFHQGSIAAMPLPERSVDAVMINQVVHHLGDHEDGRFASLRQVFAGIARVLRDDGLFVFNHCGQEQLRQGYWYHALIPEGAARFRTRFAPLDLVEDLLRETGLTPKGRFVPLDAVCQGEAYFDGRGPLSEAWRDGDSCWSDASAPELESALRKVRDLARDGGLEAFVAQHDAARPQVGQITIVSAQRA